MMLGLETLASFMLGFQNPLDILDRRQVDSQHSVRHSGFHTRPLTQVTFDWGGFAAAMGSNVSFQSRNVLSKKFMGDIKVAPAFTVADTGLIVLP
jgi:hypothetical protein